MPAQEYFVVDGDDGPSVAARFGFASFEPIWSAPENADLRKVRPNENQLFPGDRLHIPERAMEFRPAGEKAETKFTLTLPKRTFHMVLRDEAGKALDAQPYRLDGPDGELASGTTGADGKIEVELAATVRALTLTIGMTSSPVVLGGLNPMANTPDGGASGTAQRLRALGYDPGPADGSDEARLAAAITKFKTAQGLAEPTVTALTPALFDALIAAYGQ